MGRQQSGERHWGWTAAQVLLAVIFGLLCALWTHRLQ